jgi:hypothetical protein
MLDQLYMLASQGRFFFLFIMGVAGVAGGDILTKDSKQSTKPARHVY